MQGYENKSGPDFYLDYGGGMLVLSQLGENTFVCLPHEHLGIKGVIRVKSMISSFLNPEYIDPLKFISHSEGILVNGAKVKDFEIKLYNPQLHEVPFTIEILEDKMFFIKIPQITFDEFLFIQFLNYSSVKFFKTNR